MEYRDYDTIKQKCKGKHNGKWQRILREFVESGAMRRDLYNFDGGITASNAYASLVTAAKRDPFKGMISVVKDGQVVTLNRVG